MTRPSATKVLAIYNTCQISSARDNTAYYLRAITSLLAQDAVVCIQGCMMRDDTKRAITELVDGRATLLWVNEPLPLSVTVNFAVMMMLLRHKDFTHYLFLDSGMDVTENRYHVEHLCAAASGPVAVAAAVPSSDYGDWWHVKRPVLGGPPTNIPVGKTVNLHCQVYTAEFLDRYGRLLPDVFAADCSECVTPYFCAAIKRRFVVAPVFLHHEPDLDGGSSHLSLQARSRDTGWGCPLFHSPKPLKQLAEEGHKLGWGFEECQNTLKHDPKHYDSQGFTRDDELFHWLKANMFVAKFDYRGIKHDITYATRKGMLGPKEPPVIRPVRPPPIRFQNKPTLDFSILMHSRDNHESLQECLKSIRETTTALHRIEVILGIDEDDGPMHSAIAILRQNFPFVRVSAHSRRSLAESYNTLAALSAGKVVWLLTDQCRVVTKGWDRLCAERMDGVACYGRTIDSLGERHSYFPMLSRGAIEAIGYASDPHAGSFEESLYWTWEWLDRVVKMPVMVQADCEVAEPVLLAAGTEMMARVAEEVQRIKKTFSNGVTNAHPEAATI